MVLEESDNHEQIHGSRKRVEITAMNDFALWKPLGTLSTGLQEGTGKESVNIITNRVYDCNSQLD